MNVKKAILWDMDGVLVDSAELHYQSWVKALESYKLCLPHDLFISTFGRNNAVLLRKIRGYHPPAEWIQEVSDLKEKLFRENIPGKMLLLPGALTWLKTFQRWGIAQAIASSAPMENIDAVVDTLDIRQYFDSMVSGCDIAGKPDPGVFLNAAEALATLPVDCLVIEDSPAGVEGAKRGGMTCLAVETTHTATLLQKADFIVGNLEKLQLIDAAKLLRIPLAGVGDTE